MSQVNRNYVYIRDVDGHTVWERLRVIRGFLADREKALKLALLNKEKFESKKKDLDEWELKEAEINRIDIDGLIQDCIDEIEFLRNFEERLAVMAEEERIQGKSDREMYELNYIKESRIALIHRAKSEMFSSGYLTSETMSTILKDRIVAKELIKIGILNESFENVLELSEQKFLPIFEDIERATYKN